MQRPTKTLDPSENCWTKSHSRLLQPCGLRHPKPPSEIRYQSSDFVSQSQCLILVFYMQKKVALESQLDGLVSKNSNVFTKFSPGKLPAFLLPRLKVKRQGATHHHRGRWTCRHAHVSLPSRQGLHQGRIAMEVSIQNGGYPHSWLVYKGKSHENIIQTLDEIENMDGL